VADDFAVALVKMFGLAVFCDVDSELFEIVDQLAEGLCD
jgi:hypothetical protein